MRLLRVLRPLRLLARNEGMRVILAALIGALPSTPNPYPTPSNLYPLPLTPTPTPYPLPPTPHPYSS